MSKRQTPLRLVVARGTRGRLYEGDEAARELRRAARRAGATRRRATRTERPRAGTGL